LPGDDLLGPVVHIWEQIHGDILLAKLSENHVSGAFGIITQTVFFLVNCAQSMRIFHFVIEEWTSRQTFALCHFSSPF